eukprot:1825362-Prymnesium_polylepis.1
MRYALDPRDRARALAVWRQHLHLGVLAKRVFDEGATAHTRLGRKDLVCEEAHADHGHIVHVPQHGREDQFGVELGGLQPHAVLREHRLGVVRRAHADELGVADALRASVHHRRRDGLEPHGPCDDAVVRHNDHKGRAHMRLHRLTDCVRRTLSSGEPHHPRASEGRVLAAHGRDVVDVRAIAPGLLVVDHAHFWLTALAHLEAIAHDQLAAARQPAVSIQRREALKQHAGARPLDAVLLGGAGGGADLIALRSAHRQQRARQRAVGEEVHREVDSPDAIVKGHVAALPAIPARSVRRGDMLCAAEDHH